MPQNAEAAAPGCPVCGKYGGTHIGGRHVGGSKRPPPLHGHTIGCASRTGGACDCDT
jgi:hypothetical protein